MDTVTSGSFGPRSGRSVKVISRSVGREDPAPPRHEARPPCLSEVVPQATRGVTGLSVIFELIAFYEFSSLTILHDAPRTCLPVRHMSPQHTSSFHLCNITTGGARAFPLNNYLRIELLSANIERRSRTGLSVIFDLITSHKFPSLSILHDAPQTCLRFRRVSLQHNPSFHLCTPCSLNNIVGITSSGMNNIILNRNGSSPKPALPFVWS